MSFISLISSTRNLLLARTSLTALSCNGVYQALSHPGTFLTNYQQNRFKQKKIRFKAQKVAKEKKYQPRISFQTKKIVTRKVDPEFEAKYPTDNIWLRQFYPVQPCTLEETITKHKAYADPMMMDNPDGVLYAEMELNMESKKKLKYLSAVKGLLLFPHIFNDNTNTRCIVLTKDPENVAVALSMGATHAGGQDLLDMLKSDVIPTTMYDCVTCTPDIYKDLLSYRNIFKEKFPHQKQGTISTDVKTMLNSFINGIRYESKKISEETATMQVAFGKLNMKTEDLLENFHKLVDKLYMNRSPTLGPFITKVKIIAPPSEEEFHLRVQKYVPGYDGPQKQQKETTTTTAADEEDDGKDVAAAN